MMGTSVRWKVVGYLYRIAELAALAGLSTRALRHFEELGLLTPTRDPENGYRLYTTRDVDRLQQVLLYRELGLPLRDIARLMQADDYAADAALAAHLQALQERRAHLDELIHTVQRMIQHQRGEKEMTDQEKFMGLKQQLVAQNEAKYGQEARARHGEQAVQASQDKLLGMSEGQHQRLKVLEQEIARLLQAGVQEGDPSGQTALELYEAHKEWLMGYWTSYNKQAHRGLGQLYVDDPRFAAHYEAIAPGGAVYLRDALAYFCQD